MTSWKITQIVQRTQEIQESARSKFCATGSQKRDLQNAQHSNIEYEAATPIAKYNCQLVSSFNSNGFWWNRKPRQTPTEKFKATMHVVRKSKRQQIRQN